MSLSHKNSSLIGQSIGPSTRLLRVTQLRQTISDRYKCFYSRPRLGQAVGSAFCRRLTLLAFIRSKPLFHCLHNHLCLFVVAGAFVHCLSLVGHATLGLAPICLPHNLDQPPCICKQRPHLSARSLSLFLYPLLPHNNHARYTRSLHDTASRTRLD